jgi:putative transposase
MHLERKMLLAWQESTDEQSEPRVERILWIEPSELHVVTIEIHGELSLPILRTYESIVSALDTGAAHILFEDPYASLCRQEQDIKENHRERRDRAWERIAPLVAGDNIVEVLLYPQKRAALVAERIQSELCSEATMYKDLRRFWQRGMVPNALLPDYGRCGAPGKRRVAENQNLPKLGRKSAKAMGDSTGIRMTKDIERKFELGINKYFLKTDRMKLSKVFDLIKDKYFWIDIAKINGILVPILPPAEQLPTFDQFRYWYEEVYLKETGKDQEVSIARHGESTYNLRFREMLSNSNQGVIGPGYIFEIDSTLGDIYLVSSFDPLRIIGRPVVYFCVDRFSRVITGFCVTLEGPSWQSAMMAIDNVAMDKVAFCAQYGIPIEETDWPCHHLPGAFLADRAEFEGYDSDTLVNSFGLTIHNTAPYRADWKGIVERQIGLATEKAIRFTPGAVYKKRGRGEPDYRLDALLTLDDLRALLIYHTLNYNMNHYLTKYPKDQFMIADHVQRYPLEIWNWGIRNGFSHLNATVSQERIRLNLLPRKTVSVTPRGIHFKGELYYTCALAERERWFTRARLRSDWSIEVCYDTQTTDLIYLPLDGGKGLESCYLTQASKHLKGHDWHDTMDYFALEAKAEVAARSRIQQSKATFHAQKEHVISKATERKEAAEAVVGKRSKSSRIGGIRSAKQEEKQFEREQNAWKLGEEKVRTTSTNLVPTASQGNISQNDEEEYVAPASKIDRIRAHRDKEWKNKNGY